MKRFCTLETYGGEIKAFSESEFSPELINDESVAEWVWQRAETKEQAIAQHTQKHDEWVDDVNAGRPEKDTY
jgi:hypothetical protein